MTGAVGPVPGNQPIHSIPDAGKNEETASKSKVFKQLESAETRRKIGRGIQIGATAVAVVAVAAGVVALHFTPVGWAVLGVAALGIGVTTIAAIVSKARGGSFWNEVVKPQLKGIGIGVASVFVAAIIGGMVAGGSGGPSLGGAAGFGAGVMMGGGVFGLSNIGPGGASRPEGRPAGALLIEPNIDDQAKAQIRDAARGDPIKKAGKTYKDDKDELYNEAVKFVGRGTKPNLERAARRLEVLVECGDGGAMRKLELAELCMMIGKPARAAELYEDVRLDNSQSIIVAAKEVRALRKAGKYDEAIALGNAYKSQAQTELPRTEGEQRKLLADSVAWYRTQIKKAEDQKAAQ
ncbi:MAG: hypothetical protein JSR37_08840 [Verrucomicrobia bacterium]|nr:hypothetical protein [Verrucomicrobiota bacterium]MBS0637210.1 hypothetical protein [Verrucomicrobiota bacterium]